MPTAKQREPAQDAGPTVLRLEVKCRGCGGRAWVEPGALTACTCGSFQDKTGRYHARLPDSAFRDAETSRRKVRDAPVFNG